MKEIITGPDVDPMILARGTPGFSGADLQNMVKYVLLAIGSSRSTWC
jgi:ATP-dependent metalloprotease